MLKEEEEGESARSREDALAEPPPPPSGDASGMGDNMMALSLISAMLNDAFPAAAVLLGCSFIFLSCMNEFNRICLNFGNVCFV